MRDGCQHHNAATTEWVDSLYAARCITFPTSPVHTHSVIYDKAETRLITEPNTIPSQLRPYSMNPTPECVTIDGVGLSNGRHELAVWHVHVVLFPVNGSPQSVLKSCCCCGVYFLVWHWYEIRQEWVGDKAHSLISNKLLRSASCLARVSWLRHETPPTDLCEGL